MHALRMTHFIDRSVSKLYVLVSRSPRRTYFSRCLCEAGSCELRIIAYNIIANSYTKLYWTDDYEIARQTVLDCDDEAEHKSQPCEQDFLAIHFA